MKKTVRLYLAPMEGLGSDPFRRAISKIGGFDESCTPFIRVPKNPHIASLARVYDPGVTAPMPQAAQIMASEPDDAAAMCQELERRGAPRIDLNCGCPSNRVNGRGAGASLLRDPKHLHEILSAMVQSVSIPVSAKLRSGFEDTTLFDENIKAAESSGITLLTLHPRTKREGYKPPCHWDLIGRAKSLVSIPVVGSGDVLTPKDAERMINQTGCDGVMIGRGAVRNPWIFHEIKAHLSSHTYSRSWNLVESYLTSFVSDLHPLAIGQLKQLMGFLFTHPSLKPKRTEMLRQKFTYVEDMLSFLLPEIKGAYTC